MPTIAAHPFLIHPRPPISIKRIRRLQAREERERTGLLYIAGIRAVAQAAQHRLPFVTLVVCPALLQSGFAQALVGRLRRRGVPTLEVTPAVLQTLALVADPQGLGAVVRQRWQPLEQVVPGSELSWIVLETVQSPGNLGTMLRTADAVGGAGLLLLGPHVDPYHPATVRASMGALFGQRLVRTDVAAFTAWKARHGVRLVGTSPTAPTDYRAVAYQPPTLLLLGGERQGLPATLQSLCDVVVRIPMVGQSDSLNLAVATGVLLYELFNQAPCNML